MAADALAPCITRMQGARASAAMGLAQCSLQYSNFSTLRFNIEIPGPVAAAYLSELTPHK